MTHTTEGTYPNCDEVHSVSSYNGGQGVVSGFGSAIINKAALAKKKNA